MSDSKKDLKKSTFPSSGLPDWKRPEEYEDYGTWSHRRWAWEFLRRNHDYREICERFRISPARESKRASGFGSESERKKAAARFGRCDLKHYLEPYGADDSSRHWLAETIVDWQWTTSKEGECVEHFLMPGQVSLVFDLTQTEVAGTGVISVFMDHARKILSSELTRYLERDLKGPRGAEIRRDPKLRPKPKKVKPGRDVEIRLKWLRIYDALKHQDALKREVIKEFFMHVTGNDPDDPESGTQARDKALSASYLRAADFVRTEYQTLVPLDYIDNEAKIEGT